MKAQAHVVTPHRFDPVILRAYDIRGVTEENLFPEDAYHIGRAFAVLVARETGKPVQSLQLAAGRDGRLSSPELEAELVRGIKDAGAQAVRIGMGPTPMLYFAVKSRKLDAGIMVTGSHNPPTHNGFKMMTYSRPLHGQDIQELGVIAATPQSAPAQGSERQESVFEDYITALVGGFEATQNPRKLKVVWDPGNGAAGDVVSALAKRIPGEHILINEKVDGTFPAHHPDPTEEKNMLQLIETVRKHGADVGVAFDGDGDRVGAVDAKGRILWGDQLMMLYAADILEKHPGATIIGDVKTSQSLFDKVKELGGTPLIWKTGHSLIKAKIAETGALLAGEMSGHIFFADRYFGFDDGIYAAARLLNILVKSPHTLVEMMDAMPKLHNTPELRIDVPEARKFAIIGEVAERLKNAGIAYSDIDGVRVMTGKGWWLLRASNTQAALIARCESADKAALAEMVENLRAQLSSSGVTLVLSA